MEAQNYLGIYISKSSATAVCLGSAAAANVLGCFSVSLEQPDQQNLQQLAALIAAGCAERQWQFSEVAVALDCAMFMQHKLRSEFADAGQIAQTIRFDTEEALATDISDVAIAFEVASSDQAGSQLNVFTAQRKILSEIILSLQSNNLDPAVVEPDVLCLSRFIDRNVSIDQGQRPFFCILSAHNGYFVLPILAGRQRQTVVRTFLVSQTQDRGRLLTREVPLTTALLETDQPINCLKVFDFTDSVNCQQLSGKLTIEAAGIDLAQSAGISREALTDCDNPVDFAIAYGAALAHLERVPGINFRSDFLPYQGKKLRMQKALKFLSISVTILVLSVGLYFQLQLLQANRYRSRLHKKFEKQYSAVMLSRKLPDKNPGKKLKRELRRIKDVKSGQLSVTGEEAISAKLTLVLSAFNKSAKRTNLKINTISVTAKNIAIAGNTSSRKNTLRLFDAIKDSNLNIVQQRLEAKAGRDNFRLIVVPKK